MSRTRQPGGAGVSLRRSQPRYGERVIEAVLFVAALVSILTTIGIIVAIIGPTIDFFREPTVTVWDFLTGTEWTALFSEEQQEFGVLPLVSATLVTTVIAMAVAIPVGLGAAIYLAEYATPRARQVLKPTLEVLAGIPTVVYGFFAVSFITPNVLQSFLEVGTFNKLSPGLVMGVMIIPTVATLSEDAMSAVPQALRDGAYGLGSTKRQVATKVVVPAAMSGIIAAFVLGISRAVGETMIVALAAGNQANLSLNPLELGQTMTGFIAQAASGDQPTGSIGYESLFAVAALLFAITILMNFVSIRLVRRYREVYE
ncbi:MAG TPA: phosphate ABC transporter permease subunit PstC [Jiangellaceae bacterium]|nr:phosphate ABC transporter permease subunit PstC [Jiangellaceae bacterium]